MRVFLSAGEASGDAYGAAMTGEMKRIASCRFEGIGGPRMSDAGVQLLADSSQWGAIGVAQAARVYQRVVWSYYRAKSAIASGNPGLFVPIDFGYANIRLARHAKNHGWKVLYFVPPASWRRDRQGADLPRLTDAIATPFPWSADLLRSIGANAYWFGHPIKQVLRGVGETERVRQIAVLPGSRTAEIEQNLPVIAEAVKPMEWPIEFALAPGTDIDRFVQRWQRLAPIRQFRTTVGATADVLRRSHAAIVCSGTATLEAALCRCPMVVVYRVSAAIEIEAKILRFKRPKFIALPNILLDRPIVPELLQETATPDGIRSWLDKVTAEGVVREAQFEDFDELDALLGPDDAITKTAELAVSLMQG